MINKDVTHPKMKRYGNKDVTHPKMKRYGNKDVTHPKMKRYGNKDVTHPKMKRYGNKDLSKNVILSIDSVTSVSRKTTHDGVYVDIFSVRFSFIGV